MLYIFDIMSHVSRIYTKLNSRWYIAPLWLDNDWKYEKKLVWP